MAQSWPSLDTIFGVHLDGYQRQKAIPPGLLPYLPDVQCGFLIDPIVPNHLWANQRRESIRELKLHRTRIIDKWIQEQIFRLP